MPLKGCYKLWHKNGKNRNNYKESRQTAKRGLQWRRKGVRRSLLVSLVETYKGKEKRIWGCERNG